jgi:hypothetical protein
MSSKLASPQMVLNSRMLYTSWIPADPDAAARLLPPALKPAANHAIYMNQYVVDSAEAVRQYARERGVPATPGSTTLEVAGGIVTATTHVDGRPVIRTRAQVGDVADITLAGHLRYITQVRDRLVSGNYPYVGELVSKFDVLSIEFLDPTHPVYALRPASPLQVVTGSSFYAPRDSFVYPGGEYDMGPAAGNRKHAEELELAAF